MLYLFNKIENLFIIYCNLFQFVLYFYSDMYSQLIYLLLSPNILDTYIIQCGIFENIFRNDRPKEFIPSDSWQGPEISEISQKNI